MLDDSLRYSGLTAPGESHGSPLYDWLSTLAPRKLKDVFKLAEYLYFNAPNIYAASNKFFSYMVTDLAVHTTSPELERMCKRLNRRDLKSLRHALIACIDFNVYGNHFCSIYHPFTRYLVCRQCSRWVNILYVDYDLEYKSLGFTYSCPHCDHRGVAAHVRDLPDRTPSRLAITRWDPKLIDIDHNPITQKSVYYWNIPKELKERVLAGDRHLIDTMPMAILRAMSEDKLFRFADDALFHLKAPGPSGVESQWGFPPLTSTIKLFFYALILRKANEAIALDYVVPMRIISPAATSNNVDPLMHLDGARWREEMEKGIRNWRRDPLHIMFSPSSVNVAHLGGQARTLLTLPELEAAENSILAALGIPREFLYGGFAALGSGIQLRMLENQLKPLTESLVDLLQWVNDRAAAFLRWTPVEVDLVPFKYVDDTTQKQLLLNLNAASPTGQPLVSPQTLQQRFDLDPRQEDLKLMEAQLAAMRAQQKLQAEGQKGQRSLAALVAAATGQQSGERQQILTAAQGVVEQLISGDPAARKGLLQQIEGQDPVLYAVVKMQLSDALGAQRAQATSQLRQQQNPAAVAA